MEFRTWHSLVYNTANYIFPAFTFDNQSMEGQGRTSRYEDEEIEMLIPGERHSNTRFNLRSKTISRTLYFLSFALGILACILVEVLARTTGILPPLKSHQHSLNDSESHFPPADPTNWQPSLFPPDVGYPGPTPTGIEPAVLATAPAYPKHMGSTGLVPPKFIMGTNKTDGFNLFKSWGSLSPWYSVSSAEFGLPDASVEAPETCHITGVHVLHRHGARYPTYDLEWGQPPVLVKKLGSIKSINAIGQLRFLNDCYDTTNFRMKLNKDIHGIQRNRMLESSINFAFGFFGNPIEGQYQQVIALVHAGVCPNANIPAKAFRGLNFVQQWGDVYLKDAVARFKEMAPEVDWTTEDVYSMCAYETVALGYSAFCELFTKEEWDGYNDAYGSPIGQALGLGWVSELVARLTHTPIEVHNTTTNATMHDNIRFPLNQSIYVDSTHETVFMQIMTALNLTNFASDGQLPITHILPNRKFKSSKIAPFATNMQVQREFLYICYLSSVIIPGSVLSCSSHPEPQIRLIINDGVTPLTTIRGCPEDKDGMCPLKKFVDAQKETIRTSSFDWACYGDWEIEEGWATTRGMPPSGKPTGHMS
ncbi:phytase [Rhizoctonia solani AG-1 IA]|uniref:Phytase n=1 Tax=Thanatephorus cucumeris (strain AG1-IA) TaxID=983506 RepID=L8WXX6_THACA|nr:phytase [Rhizoctonia solani AG-1 IA]